MKQVLVLCVLACVLVLCRASVGEHLKFTQKLDHFNPLETRTYTQYYYKSSPTCSSSNCTNAPVFFFLGGEAPVEFFEFQEVSARQWASDYGAYYIALEHRYYGKSNPTADLSTENLRFLSSRQALADAAYFVETMQQTLTGPWVVFGCSYSGALSAWFRAKYPNLVVGSVAPSGPVQAVSNFTQFLTNFGNVAPANCASAVQKASLAVFSLTQSSSGLARLTKLFKSCEPIRAQDVTYFLWTIYDWIASTAQWENPPAWQMTQACTIMTSSADYLANFATAFVSQSSSCNAFTIESFLQDMQNTKLDNSDRTWFFQQCTEFGFFTGVNDASTSIFKGRVPLSLMEEFCTKAFGQNLVPPIGEINGYYGGFEYTGTNTFYTNGKFDPWHTLSITSAPNGGDKNVFAAVYDAAHCAPMTAPTKEDPATLTQTRSQVKAFLGALLNSHLSG